MFTRSFLVATVMVIATALTIGCSKSRTKAPVAGATGGAPPTVLENLVMSAALQKNLQDRLINVNICIQRVKFADNREAIEVSTKECPPGGGPSTRDTVAVTVGYKQRADQPTAGETVFDLIPAEDTSVTVGKFSKFNGAQSVFQELCTNEYATNYDRPGTGSENEYYGCDLVLSDNPVVDRYQITRIERSMY